MFRNATGHFKYGDRYSCRETILSHVLFEPIRLLVIDQCLGGVRSQDITYLLKKIATEFGHYVNAETAFRVSNNM
jgi:hypothetical protein